MRRTRPAQTGYEGVYIKPSPVRQSRPRAELPHVRTCHGRKCRCLYGRLVEQRVCQHIKPSGHGADRFVRQLATTVVCSTKAAQAKILLCCCATSAPTRLEAGPAGVCTAPRRCVRYFKKLVEIEGYYKRKAAGLLALEAMREGSEG